MQEEPTSFAVMLRATFDGAPLTAIEYAGKPAWIASDVGRAIGLANHRHAAQRLRERKNEGVYWRDLTPEELEVVRNPCGLDARVTSGTLVLEPGLYWLAMTAETDRAESFREWLAETHLPALRAGHGAPATPAPPPQLTAAGERIVGAKYAAIEERRRAREQRERERGDELDVLRLRHSRLGLHVKALRREIVALREWATDAAATGKVPRRAIPPSVVGNYWLDDDPR